MPHDCRRVFASEHLNNNVPVHVIQALLGHATLDTIMVYAKLYPTTLIEEYRKAVRGLYNAFARSYYATLAHETTHWTAHESRLACDFGSKRFGSEGYAIEELVAELGAAFLCADLDLTLEPREDHAAYIANWLDVLKADSRAIFTAAGHAQRAADFITACSRRPASD